MSFKYLRKQDKSKKATSVHFLKYKDKYPKSVSSSSDFSDHIDDLKIQSKKLQQNLAHALENIQYFKEMMIKFMSFNYQQRQQQMAKDAEREIQLWGQTQIQIRNKIKKVEDQLKELYCSPEKPKKKKNYALKKVYEPPSDNQ